MRIVFFGASELGYNCCEMLLQNKYNIVGILTTPSQFNIKYKEEKERITVKNYLYKDFNDFSQRNNVPVVVATEKMSEYIEVVNNWQPDLIVVVGWYFMIPHQISKFPRKGIIGIHASLLPKYRGNAPLVWAMINGEKEAGVSLFFIEGKGIDEGDIIMQESFPISNDDTIKELLLKAETSAKNILLASMPLLENDKVVRLNQDHTLATIFPKRKPEDGKIDWSWEPERIRNFIRAQTKPCPGAFTIIDGKKVTIWSADIEKI